jgi:hypothetical protein
VDIMKQRFRGNRSQQRLDVDRQKPSHHLA